VGWWIERERYVVFATGNGKRERKFFERARHGVLDCLEDQSRVPIWIELLSHRGFFDSK
jgi:hypothetical protein